MKSTKLYISSIIVFITVFVLSSSLPAQYYKEDMEKIRAGFKSKCHSFSIKYLYYPYDSIKKATDSINGSCIVDSENWYYKIRSSSGLVEYMNNGKYFVEVNHANKVILVSKGNAVKRDLWDIKKVDSLLKTPTLKISYSEKDGKGEYNMIFDNGSWNKMKLIFNKENFTLDEIWLYSSAKGKIFDEPYNKPAIGILFTSYTETVPSENDFSEEKYVHVTKEGNFEPVGSLKGFKLLNYVNKKI